MAQDMIEQAEDVSTHSRPEAAGKMETTKATTAMVSTHSRPEAAGIHQMGCDYLIWCFNSQPPGGGWQSRAHSCARGCMFQLTAARRRLAIKKLGSDAQKSVSTHSRPEAAGSPDGGVITLSGVSTHSRPEAAGWRHAV